MQEGDALGSMYEKNGLLATEDGNIFLWAGATVGGGTRVNWYVCLFICLSCSHADSTRVVLSPPWQSISP